MHKSLVSLDYNYVPHVTPLDLRVFCRCPGKHTQLNEVILALYIFCCDGAHYLWVVKFSLTRDHRSVNDQLRTHDLLDVLGLFS